MTVITMSVVPFTTATEVLEAIVAGGEQLDRLEEHLARHDVVDQRFSTEAWKGVCGGGGAAEAEERAYAARMAIVEAFTDVEHVGALPHWANTTLIELLVGSSQRTSYAAFGDEFIAGALKLALPASITVNVPRALPAYTEAAAYFDDKVNDVVRPLLQTSLKKLLVEARWDTPNLQDLIAAVVTLREMIRAPELFIDSDAAAADPAVPCIFVRRAIEGSHPAAVGVLHADRFVTVPRPIDAVALWLVTARSRVPTTDALLDALEGTDTRSSTAKSILAGRKALAAARDVVQRDATA